MKNSTILHLLASEAEVPIYRAQTPFTGRSTDNLLRSSQRSPLPQKAPSVMPVQNTISNSTNRTTPVTLEE